MKILVVDPAPSSLSDLSAVLTAKGHDVRLASRLHQAEQQLSTFHPDVTILNPAVGDMDATALINRFKEQVPEADIILYVDVRTPWSAVEAVRSNVAAIVKKEFSLHHLGAALADIDNRRMAPTTMNRRDGNRFEVRLFTDVLRELPVPSARQADGLILDLSIRGCRVCGTAPVKKGDYIALSVKLGGQAHPVEIELASVRWVGINDFGVEFIRLSGRDQQRLREHSETAGSYRVLSSDPPVMASLKGGAVAVTR